MIGKTVIFIEDFEFNGKIYKKGHEFKITGDDSMRGLDLEDSEGNRISETRFISSKYRVLTTADKRDKVINKITFEKTKSINKNMFIPKII
jgi:hypothetical protein